MSDCPECGKGKLYFSADGRARECERCHFRIEIKKPERTIAQLKEDTRPLSIQTGTEYRRGQSASSRLLLVQAIGAVKAGDQDEAYTYLTKVLRTNWDESDRLTAWLWLSQTVTKQEEKRYCLEQVLAIKPTHQVARRGLAILDGRLKLKDIVDPDKLEREISETPDEAEVEQFSCPQCSGRMNYSPDGRVLLCEFCTYQQELDADGKPKRQARFGQGEFEQEFIVALATAKGHVQPVNMRAFFCNSCAVEFVLAPETISITCPYCDAVYVTETAETHEIVPPHALLPFNQSLDDAKLAMRAWFKKHNIERPRVSPIIGIYLPVWTFDIGGEVKWNGMVKRGDEWVPINGSFLPFFDDVLVPADKKLRPNITKGFSEFDLSQLVAYDARYLADWPAERYQITLSDASLVARRKVSKQIRRDSRKYIRGETVINLRIQPGGLVIESYKHVLLPMWIAHYKYEGVVYDVAINGQNGIVHGDRPQGSISKFFSRLLG